MALGRVDNRLRQPPWPLDTPLPAAGSASFEEPGDQADHSGIIGRQFSLAASNAPELFQVAERIFHPMPPLVTPGVKLDRLFPMGTTGKGRRYVPSSQPTPEGITIIRLIPQKLPGRRQGYTRQ